LRDDAKSRRFVRWLRLYSNFAVRCSPQKHAGRLPPPPCTDIETPIDGAAALPAGSAQDDKKSKKAGEQRTVLSFIKFLRAWNTRKTIRVCQWKPERGVNNQAIALRGCTSSYVKYDAGCRIGGYRSGAAVYGFDAGPFARRHDETRLGMLLAFLNFRLQLKSEQTQLSHIGLELKLADLRKTEIELKFGFDLHLLKSKQLSSKFNSCPNVDSFS